MKRRVTLSESAASVLVRSGSGDRRRDRGLAEGLEARALAIGADAVTAPEWAGSRLWLHADLHPANVLTTDGRICGVVDFGELCAGDPALDLAAGWILLPDVAAIDQFRAASPLAGDESTWRRARGWAVWRALGCLLVAESGPPGPGVGQRSARTPPGGEAGRSTRPSRLPAS